MAATAAVVLSFTIGTLRSSQSSRAAGLFGFSKDGFSDDVPVGCKHRGSSSILDGDLFHEAGYVRWRGSPLSYDLGGLRFDDPMIVLS